MSAEFEDPSDVATDHEIAEGIRDGKFASPQKVGSFWLFDLRVTGTDAAYRDYLDEWAYRDPKLWLTDEFVERAASVPIIFGHPDRAGLDSDEYRDRAIGNMVLAYRKGDEVWGVGKIFDEDAALAMQTTHRSTSPGIIPPKGSISRELNDGTKVLDEGLPRILDHLAVCEAGVWDKDGPPTGIRLDARKEQPVAEKTKEEIEDAQRRADAEELENFRKADKARKDAEEKDREDRARKDKEESDLKAIEAAEREKADKAKKDSRKDRHAKHDGDIMDCARCDSEEAEEAKQDAGMIAPKTPVDADRGTDDIKDAKARIDMLQARIDALTAQPTVADSNEIGQAWSRWDPLYQMLGDQTPHAYPGEKPRAYLRRLADGVRRHTTSFQNYVFHDSQQATDFRLVADAIYGEALATAKKPAADRRGIVREIVTHPHGKTRTEFVGDSRDMFAPFMHPMKFVLTKINRPTGNVYS